MRRRIERDYTWNGSTWQLTNEIHFIYDGNVVVQERSAANLPQVSYTRGKDLSRSLQGAGGIGGLLARTDNTKLMAGDPLASAYYHCDGNGNVTCLMSPYQQVAAKYLYDPYGTTLAMYGALAAANTYRFSSKEWNGNSGLYYYLYRFYDPNLQKWVNRDPIAEHGSVLSLSRRYSKFIKLLGRKAGPNLYEYVGDNPITKVDPNGREILDYGPGGTCRSPLEPPPSPCPPGQTPTPYWQVMGFEDASTCATAEWQANRDNWAGALGGGLGGILGIPGGGVGITVGGTIGVGIGGSLIPNIICNSIICVN